MKKCFILTSSFVLTCLLACAQKKADSYPIPEYDNEIYLVKKDSGISLLRMEKGTSKQEMKVKVMGMGGMDQGYALEGEKSTVRLQNGNGLVFILYSGEGAGSSSLQSDSLMRANGMDPAMMANPMSSMMDPAQNIALYNMNSVKGQRKILLQSMGIMGKSKKTATKYTLSIKKLKEGYTELIVDKSLPPGEYAFVMMNFSMDQSYALFAFAID
jgi:hypothetical protein